MTLSEADTQWPDFFMLLDPDHPLDQMSELEGNRYRQRIVNENPHIVAIFLTDRAEYFIKDILK